MAICFTTYFMSNCIYFFTFALGKIAKITSLNTDKTIFNLTNKIL